MIIDFNRLVFPLLLTAFISRGAGQEVLRVSRVVGEHAPNAERLELVAGDDKEVLFVSRESIITEDDVEDAWPQSTGHGAQVGIKLSEQGAARMGEATGKMKLGSDRLAVLVEGALEMAPIVQDRLRANFVIRMGPDGTFDQASALVGRLLGEEPPTKDAEAFDESELPQLPETRPYTEEECQELKLGREQIGVHYLDEIPSKEELDKQFKKGMSEEQVVGVLGKPSLRMELEGGFLRLVYDCAPERLPLNPNGEMRPIGVSVHFDADSQTYRSWSYSTGNEPRKRKVVGRPEPLLRVVIPKLDYSDPELDFSVLIEGMTIPDLTQKVNHTDLYKVLGMIEMVSTGLDEGSRKVLSSDCDIVKFLAQYLPEFEQAIDKAENGKVKIEDLKEAGHPYMWDSKPLPDLKFPDSSEDESSGQEPEGGDDGAPSH